MAKQGNIPQIAVGPARAAGLIGVCESTVWNWMKQDRLKYTKVGGRRLIRIADLEAMFDKAA